ncbi:phytosulfokines 3-like [Prosopis cineraria]|uniref:phytosulfokines 3-like n=1 Tax=Prosopis cineraria TaxID=364024 RepID=UPI00240FBC24|nr:phytosulfokines 3-like [Prosopis cineraria]
MVSIYLSKLHLDLASYFCIYMDLSCHESFKPPSNPRSHLPDLTNFSEPKARMAKIAALFFTALCLCHMLAHASRPEPSFHEESVEKTQHEGDIQGVEDKCEDVSADGCLMRRTLVAHLDYIYTQSPNINA